jgi:hypothetical protein
MVMITMAVGSKPLDLNREKLSLQVDTPRAGTHRSITGMDDGGIELTADLNELDLGDLDLNQKSSHCRSSTIIAGPSPSEVVACGPPCNECAET